MAMNITTYSFNELTPTEVVLRAGRNHIIKIHNDIHFESTSAVTAAAYLMSGALPNTFDVVQDESMWGISGDGALTMVVIHYPT
jgi:hypothetical protein